MALLEFSNLTYGFTDTLIIDGPSGALHPGNVIGLVGVNGGGKTTLLRLLTGELQTQGGRVQRQKGLRLGYVGQKVEGDDEKLLFAYVRGGRDDLLALEQRIADLSELLAERHDDEAAITRLGEAQAQYASLGGHRWVSEVERLLYGLSFTLVQFSQPLGSLSGGQRQKAALARALLSGSQCLVFDEPTNHLDIDAQAFFADYVKALAATRSDDSAMAGGQRGVLLVSHDRWLLDRLCSHIWELEDGALHRYSGGFTRSAEQRTARREQAMQTYQRQAEQITRTEDYIRRNIAGQNTKQARGRRTHLARMERLEKPTSDPQMAFVLRPAVPTGEQVLVVQDLEFGYGGNLARTGGNTGQEGAGPSPHPAGDGQGRPPTRVSTGDDVRSPDSTHLQAGSFGLDLNPPLEYKRGNIVVEKRPLIDDLTFTLYRGERLAIVGPNGSGKTTLLKLLTRRLSAQRGMAAWGSNVELGIFSQDSADLSAGHNLLAELRDVEPGISDGDARSYLARFGFSGDDVMKDVGALSGGERSRLSLAKIFRRRPNVLILDEPTNHLDIYAREALEQFLSAYEGTIVMVTHDRALLERLCKRLVVFERDNGGYESAFFRGDYEHYVGWRDAQRNENNPTVGAAASRPEDGDKLSPPQESVGGLPTIPELTELARQQRTSVEGYCRKQSERERKRADETEQCIEDIELRSAELVLQQRDADATGKYAEIGVLQEQIDTLEHELEQAFEELHEIEERAESWERLADTTPN
ncbi:MAG: ABC-F family ATP-binding cassette domain-containing protein [bacterium]|nr:ABC-F family ATP-binding cassette domain-containing protein [bacterium]